MPAESRVARRTGCRSRLQEGRVWKAVLLAMLLCLTCGSFAQAKTERAKNDPTKVSTNFDKYDALITAVTIFVLAVFVGYEVINKVPTTLHTPLMSGSNAISGITVVGAIIVGGYALDAFSSFLGFLAIVLAMINVVGGFLVTHRMLAMFKRR